jgi:hypothetical protein
MIEKKIMMMDLFTLLRYDITCAINPASISISAMVRVDIVNPDGTTSSETTKDGLEDHLLNGMQQLKNLLV